MECPVVSGGPTGSAGSQDGCLSSPGRLKVSGLLLSWGLFAGRRVLVLAPVPAVPWCGQVWAQGILLSWVHIWLLPRYNTVQVQALRYLPATSSVNLCYTNTSTCMHMHTHTESHTFTGAHNIIAFLSFSVAFLVCFCCRCLISLISDVSDTAFTVGLLLSLFSLCPSLPLSHPIPIPLFSFFHFLSPCPV